MSGISIPLFLKNLSVDREILVQVVCRPKMKPETQQLIRRILHEIRKNKPNKDDPADSKKIEAVIHRAMVSSLETDKIQEGKFIKLFVRVQI